MLMNDRNWHNIVKQYPPIKNIFFLKRDVNRRHIEVTMISHPRTHHSRHCKFPYPRGGNCFLIRAGVTVWEVLPFMISLYQ